ncbi:MAG: tetratricopeptide repeat protein [Acidobacteriota bacterium]|jgi:hypothetical protein
MTWRLCLVPPVLVCSISFPAALHEGDPPRITVSPIAGSLHQLVVNGNVRVTASIGEDGTLLVDTVFAANAPSIQGKIANYERSLELNPENANAITMLARIRGEE